MSNENRKSITETPSSQGGVSGSVVKHQLEYCIYSCKVSWCPKCHKHFYNERNEIHTTKATSEHYHILDCH